MLYTNALVTRHRYVVKRSATTISPMIKPPPDGNTLYLLAFEVFTTVPSLVHSTTGGGLAAGGLQGKYIDEPGITSTISVGGVGMFQSLPNATKNKKRLICSYNIVLTISGYIASYPVDKMS